jgi:hypothetical protein
MTDRNWSDYVADAGTDPAALSEASTSMGDSIEATQAGVEAIDPSLLSGESVAAKCVRCVAASTRACGGW